MRRAIVMVTSLVLTWTAPAATRTLRPFDRLRVVPSCVAGRRGPADPRRPFDPSAGAGSFRAASRDVRLRVDPGKVGGRSVGISSRWVWGPGAGVEKTAVTASPVQDPAHPIAGMVDTPTVKVLRGLTVPEFEAEMQLMNQALGVSCGHCHVRGNFASEENPFKPAARRMLEMTRSINQQFFPDYKPVDGESKLGKVTCFTCHQGLAHPKTVAGNLHD
jgi:hypothetical protein